MGGASTHLGTWGTLCSLRTDDVSQECKHEQARRLRKKNVKPRFVYLAFFLASAATTTSVSILCSLRNETICRMTHLYLFSAFISLTHTHVNVHNEAGTALSDTRAEPPLVSHVSLITASNASPGIRAALIFSRQCQCVSRV